MKILKNFSLVLVCALLAATSFSSCDWDASNEPEHPLYVSYSISAGYISFIGPDQLLLDIQSWIKANQFVYDKQVDYDTGEASDFEKTDKDAVKKYEEFAPKFKAYLEGEVKKDLAAGKYNNAETNTPATVISTFYISATRVQGKGGNLKYEEFKFSYP